MIHVDSALARRSWRQRFRGSDRELWDSSLADEDYPTVSAIADHWAQDELEMRAWITTLSDRTLAQIAGLGDADRFPLYGHQVPDVEFLYDATR